ncbi:hypothetical protein CRYUN_Cryun35bG0070900 [Craigia yunnanensis]
MMSSSSLVLDTALDQSGLRVSLEIVEDVLKRFEDAGMLAYRFLEWAEKLRNYMYSVRAYHTMIESLAENRQYHIMWDLMNTMRNKSILNVETFCIIMKRAPNLPKAREIFKEIVDMGYDLDVVTYGIMVDIFYKVGRVDEVIIIVREMDSNGCRPTSYIYSVLVHTYGIENKIEDVIDAFQEMERNGIKADVVMYNALIGAFCKVNKLKNVYRILNKMDSKGMAPNVRTCNIILSSLIGRGETDEAFKVFCKLIKECKADADTYTIMIKMFCERDELDMAFKVRKYMKLKQFIPSMHTFSVLIHGLCEKGNAAKACVLLEEMLEKGI